MLPPEDRDLRLLYTNKPIGDNPVLINCLYHHDDSPSLAVYRDHAFCYGCRHWAGYWQFLDDIEREDAPQAIATEKETVFQYTPEEFLDLAKVYNERMYKLGKQDYWFRKRFFTQETVDKYLLGYAASSYTIPVWNNGVVQTIRFRRDDAVRENGPKYYGVKGFNNVMLFSPQPIRRKVIWCEGELDSLLLVQLGYSAITLTNGIRTVSDAGAFLPSLEPAKVVVIAVDCDDASWEPALDLAALLRTELPGKYITMARFFAKDITEYYEKKGEIGVRELLR